MAVKRCKGSFAVMVGGAPRVIPAGALVDANDPVLRGREHHFEDVETYVSDRAARVEQATAEPGERRAIPRPTRKTAAKKTAARKPAAPQAAEETKGAEGEG